MSHNEFQWLASILGLIFGSIGFVSATVANTRCTEIRKEIARLRRQVSDPQADTSKLNATRAH